MIKTSAKVKANLGNFGLNFTNINLAQKPIKPIHKNQVNGEISRISPFISL